MTTITLPRATVEQALECLRGVARGKYDGNAAGVCAALEAALAQQAEPDHETRAELAEQQVVQLAEERDHYRNLWQKAQKAESADVVGLLEYRGNSVAFIYQKMTAYSSGIDAAWDAFRAKELHPDGKTSLADMIAKHTTPPQRKPLTDEEIEACRQQGYAHAGLSAPFDFGKAARAIERAHGIPKP